MSVDLSQTLSRTGSRESTMIDKPNEVSKEGYLLHLVRSGDVSEVSEVLNNSEHPRFAEVTTSLEAPDSEGKTPLDLAICLGHLDIMKELHKKGASISDSTATGYTPLHRAAAWNRLACLRYLVQQDVNIFALTKHNEKARDIADRYGHNECRWYLEWAEVRQDLMKFLKEMRDVVMEPERILGRLTKDDKNQTIAVCQEKLEWAESAHDVTMEEIREKRREIENFLEHVIHKLNEPPVEKVHKK